MQIALAALVGMLAGAHAATWGMYKDAIHEGFSRAKYSRSIVLGAALGALGAYLLDLDPIRPAQLVVLFGVVYGVERILVELWKTFVRDEDQSKYFIPMQFAVFGRPVQSRGVRLAIGTFCLAAIVGGALILRSIETPRSGSHAWLTIVLVGLATGSGTAIGGAWKDAPKEGFELLKFFRSPLLTTAFAAFLASLTTDLVAVFFGTIGFERASIETYKTFFFPSRPRGKFSGKPILFPVMLRQRQRFIPLFFGIWLVVLGAVVLAFLEPRLGLI
jgi:hypothetical protein